MNDYTYSVKQEEYKVVNVAKHIHPNMSNEERNALKEYVLVPNETVTGVITREEVDRIMFHAHEIGASEISFQSHQPVKFNISGEWFDSTRRILNEYDIDLVNNTLYGGLAKGLLNNREDINCAYSIPLKNLPNDIKIPLERFNEYIRYRVNITSILINGISGSEASIRVIKSNPMNFDEITVEPYIRENYWSKDGLVLVCGSTGNGKSTLLDAMMLDQITSGKSLKIIMYSQPIEATYDKVLKGRENVILTQSEIPLHLKSFQHGVENSLRRNADIAVVGESRDYESISAALEFAQTGGLLFTTLHVNDSVGQMFYRMVNMFPERERSIKVYEILEALRFAVIQRLEPSLKGGRIAVREYLKFTPDIISELRKLESLRAMQIALIDIVKKHGCSLSQSAKKLYEEGHLSRMVYERYQALDVADII